MASSTIKNAVVTTRIATPIKEQAKKNLESQGLTMSEFLRLAVISAANDQVRVMSFLDTPEALQAKKEVESGKVGKIGTLEDLDAWIDKL